MSAEPSVPKPMLVADVRRLLSETPYELDADLSHRLGAAIHVFSNGKVLLSAVGGGLLFDSREQLLAFMSGEVLRRAVDGHWRMREGPAGWEPWIVAADDRAYAILGIAKDIQEHGRTVSLRAFVIAKIHGRGSSL
jgi:hypothetical protein